MNRDPLPDVSAEIARIEEMIRTEPFRDRRNDRSPARAVRPRLAASILLIDEQSDGCRLIMGRRNAALKFMPGALVFPGGRVDPLDHRIEPGDSMEPAVRQQIALGLPGKDPQRRAQALAVAAIRELAEETGVVLGTPSPAPPPHGDWADFAARGLRPGIGKLKLLARAVTPPGLPRRFDTWFFARKLFEDERKQVDELRSSGELERLGWFTPEEALASETREITRVILVELINRLKIDPHLARNPAIPCYTTRRGRFRRRLLPDGQS